jgi:hypothetical protein
MYSIATICRPAPKAYAISAPSKRRGAAIVVYKVLNHMLQSSHCQELHHFLQVWRAMLLQRGALSSCACSYSVDSFMFAFIIRTFAAWPPLLLEYRVMELFHDEQVRNVFQQKYSLIALILPASPTIIDYQHATHQSGVRHGWNFAFA